MAKSNLIIRRKKSTVLVSTRTLEDAIQRANMVVEQLMETDPNDSRINKIQGAVSHMSRILKATPQQMQQDNVQQISDYMDNAKMPAEATNLKNEVDMIAKMQSELRGQGASPEHAGQPVSYVPDNAVLSSKNANGAAFVSDRDEKGEAKAPEKLEVPRLAKKKKEAIPEEPVAAPAAVPAPAPAAAAGGKVNPIEYIPTETLIKVIEDLPKEEDFAQNKGKQDALIELTNILKTRPVLPAEPVQGQAAAPAAPAKSTAPALAEPVLPIAASAKKADYGDHAVGQGDTISNGSGASSAIGQGGSSAAPTQVSTDSGISKSPAPEKKVDLGGLSVASAEKTADDYRMQDFKVTDEGVRPSGGLPTMDEQGHGEMDFDAPSHEMDLTPTPNQMSASVTAALKEIHAALAKLASAGYGGGWYTSYKPVEVTEDGGRTPEIGEAHSKLEDNTGISHPATVEPIKLNDQQSLKTAADLSTSKAVKEAEKFGGDLKKMYLDAKSLTAVNDTRAVREAVEAIFRAADMFDEATKTLSKQDQQEKSEAEAAEIKEKNKGKKSSFAGLALAASAE